MPLNILRRPVTMVQGRAACRIPRVMPNSQCGLTSQQAATINALIQITRSPPVPPSVLKFKPLPITVYRAAPTRQTNPDMGDQIR